MRNMVSHGLFTIWQDILTCGTPAVRVIFVLTETAAVHDSILGSIPVMYRTDREIDVLRIARARALLARAPVGSKLAAIYAASVAGIAYGYPAGTI